MVLVGLLLGLVGTDVNSGLTRYTFGVSGAVGRHRLLAAGDRACSASSRSCATWSATQPRAVQRPAESCGRRGTTCGLLAGGPARHRSRLAARHPAGRRRGAGGVRELHAGEEGRQGPEPLRQRRDRGRGRPEAANNAGAQTSFIPLLTLGLPSNAVMALMMGAMIIQGISPGRGDDQAAGSVLGHGRQHVDRQPHAAGDQPAADRDLGRLLSVPYRLLYPAILLFCVIGIYSTNNNSPNWSSPRCSRCSAMF